MPGATNGLNKDGEKEERYRTGVVKGSEAEDQIWSDLDMGGANLRVMGTALFNYAFLTRLYFNNNKLKVVPSAIGKLKNLTLLDLSLNELTEIPAEMGMLVNLKELLLVDNQLEILPFELGNLFQLQMLAIDGNPLIEEQRDVISEKGVTGIIEYLRENAPSKYPSCCFRCRAMLSHVSDRCTRGSRMGSARRLRRSFSRQILGS